MAFQPCWYWISRMGWRGCWMGLAMDKPSGCCQFLGCCAGNPARHVGWEPPTSPLEVLQVIPAWQEVDPAGPGSAGSALLGGGSESLCPRLQPAFGPASVGQMCTRRRGVTAVRGLCLCPCPAVTCWDGAECPWGKLPQVPSPAVFPLAAPAAPGGLESRPRHPGHTSA